MDTAFHITPDHGFQEIPLEAVDGAAGAFFTGGSPNPATLKILPLLTSIISTVAPCAEAYLGCKLYQIIDDEDAEIIQRDMPQKSFLDTDHGKAQRVLGCVVDPKSPTPKIFVEIGGGIQDDMTGTAFHEAFHAVSRHMPDQYRYILNGAVADGAEWPTRYGNNQEERRARMFEHYSMARLEGWQPTPWLRDEAYSSAPQDVLERICDGTVGRAIKKNLDSPPPSGKEDGKLLTSLRRFF